MMKLLYPQEYKAVYPNNRLTDYLDYLEQIQKELKEAIECADKIALKKSYVDDIEGLLNEIDKLLNIIEEHLEQLMIMALDNLSLEDLQEYFSEEKAVILEEEKEKCLSEKDYLESELEAINEKIADLEESEREYRAYFEVQDADVFFKLVTLRDFLGKLLSQEMTPEIRECYKRGLKKETERQNIKAENTDLDELADRFVDLIRKSQIILEYSPQAKEDVIDKLYRINPVDEHLVFINYDTDTFLRTLLNMKNEPRYNTEFFKGLPKDLQEILQAGDSNSVDTFDYLQSYFTKLQNKDHIEIPIPDKDIARLATIKARLLYLNDEIGRLEGCIENERVFRSSQTAMRDKLKSIISSYITSNVTSDELTAVIEKVLTEKEKIEENLQNVANTLKEKEERLKKAQSMLESDEYETFFEETKRRADLRVLEAYGINFEDSIEPFLETEKRRMNQIYILYGMQERLETQRFNILSMKESSWLNKQTSSYKNKLQSYKDKYANIIEEALRELREQGLIEVCVPTVEIGATPGTVRVIPKAPTETEIDSLDELAFTEQTFWNFTNSISDEVRKAFLDEDELAVPWEDFANDLISRQEKMIKKLISPKQDEDGLYGFKLTSKELEELISVQDIIIEVITQEYEARKNMRNDICPPSIEANPCELAIDTIVGPGSSYTKENVQSFVNSTRIEVETLKRYLIARKKNCSEFGIEVPDISEIKDTHIENADVDFDKLIRDLHIQNVETLKEAIKHRDALKGLEEFELDADEVKRFYLSKPRNDD